MDDGKEGGKRVDVEHDASIVKRHFCDVAGSESRAELIKASVRTVNKAFLKPAHLQCGYVCVFARTVDPPSTDKLSN